MRNLTSLSTKLMALLAVPTIALVAGTGLGVLRASDHVARERTAAEGVELSLAAAEAARQLSLEGDLSASVVSAQAALAPTSPPADDSAAGDEATDEPRVDLAPPDGPLPEDLELQRRATDETLDDLRAVIDEGGQAAQLHMHRALDGLSRLDEARDAVDERSHGTGQVSGAYRDIAEPILEVNRLLQGSAGAELLTRLEAHLALTRAIQSLARQQSLVASILAAGTIDPSDYQRVLEVATSERHWLGRFEDTASSDDLERYSEAEAAPVVTATERLREDALAAGPGGPATGDPRVWANGMGRRIDMLEGLAEESAAALADRAAGQLAAAQSRRSVALLLFAGSVVLAVGSLAVLQRLVLGPLRRLAAASRGAAQDTVPRAIELAETDGEQVARAAILPLEAPPAAELQAVAEAVNRLQDTAVELAVANASGRGDVSNVFLHFGLRTQKLVTRQLDHIDHLEAHTEDPDTLADLFLLDHLATRLRRNAESLVVLAGADSPRPWSRPVSVVNVVRAAVAEAADYSRVDLSPMPPAMVVGACANDVSHLLAELIDNALSFSPPESRVVVAGHAQDDGRYMVAVADAGVGLSPRQLAELNERITRTPVAEVGRTRYFGLFVVGRLAQRHGIAVRLVPSCTEGTTAQVLLPRSLLATTAQRPDGNGHPMIRTCPRDPSGLGVSGASSVKVRPRPSR